MAAVATTKKKRRANRKKEPWHGTIGGYSNHKCRCDACKLANADYMAAYREKRFTGVRCSVRGCKRQASPATGNGKCARHSHE